MNSKRKKVKAQAVTTKIEINALPRIKLLDAQKGRRQQIELLSSFVQNYFSENSEAINILEAGCGRRWNLDLAGIKYKLTGVDINKEALEFRITHKRDLDRTILGDLRIVDLNPDKFDMIYCVDVIEHIKGVEQVLKKFFAWLRPKGLLILVFPDRDSVFGFFTRLLPHWVHILYYKYIRGLKNAGKPGFGPFPTYYDEIVSRNGIYDFCYRHGHNIVLEYGRPYDLRLFGWLAAGARILFKFIEYFSFKKLAADYSGLVFVIVCLQKVLDRSGIKIREGFRFQIPSFSLLGNL
jgi:2-polyprenyl-3-methyl-5-hydroxy-6-metoxy-1,4-benzoquinol methylase